MERVHGFFILVCMFSFLTIGKTQSRVDLKQGVSYRFNVLNHEVNRTTYSDTFWETDDYTPSIQIAYRRDIFSPLIQVEIPFSVGIAKLIDAPLRKSRIVTETGATINIGPRLCKGNFKPYGLAGLSFIFNEIDAVYVAIPFGAGINLHLGKGFHLNIQSGYNYGLKNNRNNIFHSIGFVQELNTVKSIEKSEGVDLRDEKDADAYKELKEKMRPDKDGDGIYDDEDDCPNEKGLAIFKGCPDKDQDGVIDSEDDCPDEAGPIDNLGCPKEASTINDTDGDGLTDENDNCPEIAGPIENLGCPIVDTDGDGISDDKDKCPELAGTEINEGCPDSDSDGIVDNLDDCPNIKGLKEFNGCPDTDGDGIADPNDKCPNVAAINTEDGCPKEEIKPEIKITTEESEVLSFAAQSVEFESSKAAIKSQSYPILDKIYNILIKYPDYKLNIAGHTDSIGSSKDNQLLSERRAEACKDYFMRKGISANRIFAIGFGEKQPIADNRYKDGRAKNRRVVFTLN